MKVKVISFWKVRKVWFREFGWSIFKPSINEVVVMSDDFKTELYVRCTIIIPILFWQIFLIDAYRHTNFSKWTDKSKLEKEVGNG